MPNVQHPGFYPTRNLGGGTVTYRRARVLSNNTNAIALQDAVTVDTNGNVLGQAQTGTLSTAVHAVAMGTFYVNADGVRTGAKQLPAATTYTGSTVDPENASYVFLTEGAHNVVFRCSVDAAITIADLGTNMGIALAPPVNGISSQELVGSTKATTATLPMRVTDFCFTAGVDPDAADARVFAMINAGVIEPALTTTGL
jgi:hypothetical protein